MSPTCPRSRQRASYLSRHVTANPAVLLECLLALLDNDGNDVVLVSARQTAHAIRAQLPEGRLQHTFSAWISSRAPAVLTG